MDTPLDFKKLRQQYHVQEFRKVFDVYVFLMSCFGRSFAESYGVEPWEEWFDALSRLTQEEVNIGIDNVLHGAIPYVPTIQEFVAYCKAGANHSKNNRHESNYIWSIH